MAVRKMVQCRRARYTMRSPGQEVVVEVAHGDKIVPRKEPRTCGALGTLGDYLLRYP